MSTTDSKQTTIEQTMSYPSILFYNDKLYPFDPHKVIYGPPSATEQGGHVIKCEYPLTIDIGDGKTGTMNVPIEFESPPMKTGWGVSSKDYKEKTRITVDVLFEPDAGPKVKAFHAVMQLWDKLLLAKIKENRAKWFTSKKITDDILEYLFNNMVRTNVDKEGRAYPDSFRTNIQQRNGKPRVEVYDITEKPIEMERITRHSIIRERFYQTGIWFSDQMISSSFSSKQIQLLAEGECRGFGFAGGYNDGYSQPATMTAFGGGEDMQD